MLSTSSGNEDKGDDELELELNFARFSFPITMIWTVFCESMFFWKMLFLFANTIVPITFYLIGLNILWIEDQCYWIVFYLDKILIMLVSGWIECIYMKVTNQRWDFRNSSKFFWKSLSICSFHYFSRWKPMRRLLKQWIQN